MRLRGNTDVNLIWHYTRIMGNWPIKRFVILGLGLAIGALGGYLYWYYVGCYSGTCPITSKASISSIYGLVMGGLLASSVWDSVKKDQKSNDKNQTT